jgi:hypothetical protein
MGFFLHSMKREEQKRIRNQSRTQKSLSPSYHRPRPESPPTTAKKEQSTKIVGPQLIALVWVNPALPNKPSGARQLLREKRE